MREIVLHLSASALYALLALHFWRTRWRQAHADGMALWERYALLLPLLMHGVLLYDALITPTELRFGFAHALSAMLWLGVFIFWFESLVYDLEGMQPLILPLAALACPLPLWFTGLSATHAASTEFKLHLALGIAAYSVFTIALLHALLMAIAERSLLRGHRRDVAPVHVARLLPAGPMAGLPPLLTLERLLFRMITLAFVLLTLTLASGVIFSETLFGRALRFDHKTLFAVLSWCTFAALLAGRHTRGWRGRTALRFTLGGFVLLLLAYVGSRFVLQVLLGRT